MATNNAINLNGVVDHAIQLGNAGGSLNSLSLGSSGQILQSSGAGADPIWTTSTFPSTNVQGAIIYGSAANVYSNLAPGTDGDVLTLAGGVPTWAAAASGGELLQSKVILTSAQVKTLRASPVVIIPAPGAGNFINPIVIVWKLNYGGTNPFIASVGQTIPLAYTNASGTLLTTSGFSNSSIIASSDQIGYAILANNLGTAATNRENQPIVAFNAMSTEISGNADNNNTITINVTYQILSL